MTNIAALPIPDKDCQWEQHGHNLILTTNVSCVHVNRGGWIQIDTKESFPRTLKIKIPPLWQLRREPIMISKWKLKGQKKRYKLDDFVYHLNGHKVKSGNYRYCHVIEGHGAMIGDLLNKRGNLHIQLEGPPTFKHEFEEKVNVGRPPGRMILPRNRDPENSVFIDNTFISKVKGTSVAIRNISRKKAREGFFCIVGGDKMGQFMIKVPGLPTGRKGEEEKTEWFKVVSQVRVDNQGEMGDLVIHFVINPHY